MELIKQIKQAEAESKQIVEQAKAESTQILAATAAERSKKLEQAGLERNEIIKKAVSLAKTQGLAEAEQLKATAERALKDLRENAAKKSNSVVAKIVEAVNSVAD